MKGHVQISDDLTKIQPLEQKKRKLYKIGNEEINMLIWKWLKDALKKDPISGSL